MFIYCIHCQSPTKNPKFCSQSCSASYNNKGKRRHGNPKNKCLVCKTETKSSKAKFCSISCCGKFRQIDYEIKKANNAERQSRYRQKKYRQIHSTANKELIKKFYQNCPDGHEVDHIIPLSKGGLHHQDNLQYLLKEENRKKGNRVVVDVGIEPTRSLDIRL